MTNLEQLKQEARERFNPYLYRFLSKSQKEQHEADIDKLIDHIHTMTVEECIDALPGHEPDACKGEYDYELEAISRLQALITEPGV